MKSLGMPYAICYKMSTYHTFALHSVDVTVKSTQPCYYLLYIAHNLTVITLVGG